MFIFYCGCVDLKHMDWISNKWCKEISNILFNNDLFLLYNPKHVDWNVIYLILYPFVRFDRTDIFNVNFLYFLWLSQTKCDVHVWNKYENLDLATMSCLTCTNQFNSNVIAVANLSNILILKVGSIKSKSPSPRTLFWQHMLTILSN